VAVQHDDATGPARGRAAAYTDTEQALITRLQALSTEHGIAPDEDFRVATRTRLVAMAAVRTPAAETPARRPPVHAGALRRLLAGAPDATSSRWRTRLTAGLAGAALTLTALGGLLAAAQGARPGDLLYDVKRGGEQTQLALASDSARGLTLLQFASSRLDELDELVGVEAGADAVVGSTPSGGETGLAAGPDVDLVLDTLHTMDGQTTQGTAALTSRAVERSDRDALEFLTGWAAGQQSGLDRLVDAVPTGAQGALTASQGLVAQVAARGSALEQALACPGGPATDGADELGPLPAACAPEQPAITSAPAPSGPGSGSSASSDATGRTTDVGTTSAAAPTAPLPSGGNAPTRAAPATSAVPQLPLPSLPGLPPTTAAPSSSSGALVSVPPLVPGVSVCVPPLVTVGC
jgi:hypothetical protein